MVQHIYTHQETCMAGLKLQVRFLMHMRGDKCTEGALALLFMQFSAFTRLIIVANEENFACFSISCR
jgi:hypothetical protein